MKRTLPSIGVVLALFLLIGAGCTDEETAQKEKPQFQAKSAESMIVEDSKVQENQNTTEQDALEKQANFSLTGTALGGGEVKFAWNIPDGIERTEALRLIRSTEANPEFNGKNYWYQVSGEWNAATWISLPTGTQHFRLCTFENGSCQVYSEDVEIEVT